MPTPKKPRRPPDEAKPKKNGPLCRKLSQAEIEQLSAFLETHGITRWDWIVIGDGSGSGWDGPAGFASVLIDNATRTRHDWAGSLSRASINMAEMMALLHPLNWLASVEADRRSKRGSRVTALRIHLFTDSEYTSNTGSNRNRKVHKNGLLWSCFDALTRQGLVLFWHWIRRETVPLQIEMDEQSKIARSRMVKYNKRRWRTYPVEEDS